MLSVTVEVNFGIIKILMLILVPVFVCVCVDVLYILLGVNCDISGFWS